MCTRHTLTVIFAVVSLASLAASTVRGIETPQGSPSVTRAFAVSKQRFTLGMPEGSRKTLVDLWEPGLVLRWSTRSLLDVDALKAGVGQPNEQLRIVPRIPPHWQRSVSPHRERAHPGDGIPRDPGPVVLGSVGGADADIVKIVLRSTDGEPLGIGIVLQSPNASRNEDFVLLREDKSLFCAVAGECTCRHSSAGMEITVSAGKDPHTVWIAIPHRALGERYRRLSSAELGGGMGAGSGGVAASVGSRRSLFHSRCQGRGRLLFLPGANPIRTVTYGAIALGGVRGEFSWPSEPAKVNHHATPAEISMFMRAISSSSIRTRSDRGNLSTSPMSCAGGTRGDPSRKASSGRTLPQPPRTRSSASGTSSLAPPSRFPSSGSHRACPR